MVVNPCCCCPPQRAARIIGMLQIVVAFLAILIRTITIIHARREIDNYHHHRKFTNEEKCKFAVEFGGFGFGLCMGYALLIAANNRTLRLVQLWICVQICLLIYMFVLLILACVAGKDGLIITFCVTIVIKTYCLWAVFVFMQEIRAARSNRHAVLALTLLM